MVRKDPEDQTSEEIEKQYIAVYELPSMKMCEDADGNRTSIYVDGLEEFRWSPKTNVLIYTHFPQLSDNAFPRVLFQEIPSRRNLHIHTAKDSLEMQLYFHPQGSFLAVVNKIQVKKNFRYTVDIFDISELYKSVPQQQIIIERDVETFHGCVWEPHQSKLAIHTLSKKVLEAGQK